eukprot:TRINITY_DN1013_c0_g1_i6.p1 TRINITY_DN1013_c0_g1~~TRINITY_DN1013_c0_g1_i6.p1  ORF type:complete len:180 (-),score=31.68 TRINITY_DN1013_c0_g1_i6:54-593(-)
MLLQQRTPMVVSASKWMFRVWRQQYSSQRVKLRTWQPAADVVAPSTGVEAAAAPPAAGASVSKRPYPKRKVGLLVGFQGSGYVGMQYQPGMKTIEGELEMAIYKAGGILETNHLVFHKMGWSRSARTDRGVSAAGMVVGMKMEMVHQDMTAEINKHLPSDIRVHGVLQHRLSFFICVFF